RAGRPVKRHAAARGVNELGLTMKRAFHLATTGRPGPVLVDIPKGVSNTSARFQYPQRIAMRSYNPVTRGHAGQIKKAVNLLLEAKRPMVYVGGGAILRSEEHT